MITAMSQRYLIANWKMKLPAEGIESYLNVVGADHSDDTRLVVAPPFPYIDNVARITGEKFAVGAQNCADRASGALTGEVSPLMVRECGARYVILGHSERRSMFGETDALIGRKLALVIECNLTPVLCIGEDLRVRDAGHVARFLADQLKAVVSPVLDAAPLVIIAYEPVWAIGTGRNASGEMVAETVGEIRESLRRFWPSRHADEAPILYGGSVTPDNVQDVSARGNIDGYLVGGASLQSSDFLAIRRGMPAALRAT